MATEKTPVKRVFVSINADSNHTEVENSFKWKIVEKLFDKGFLPEIFTPPPGKRYRGLAVRKGWTFNDVEEIMSRCVGHVIIGMPRWKVGDDVSGGKILPSEYHHYEGAISHMLNLPTLIFSDPTIVNRGVFNRSLGRFIVSLPRDYNQEWLESEHFQYALNDWIDEIDNRRDIFLGYSTAAKGVAKSIKRYIEKEVCATVWDWEDDFYSGDNILSQIKKAVDRCSLGIFLFTKDDQLEGGLGKAAPRDNVVFEAGYFASTKGHGRILVILESGAKMPADLGGQIYALLEDRSNIEPIGRRIWSFIHDNL